MTEHTKAPWRPGQNRIVILSLREGHPDRRLFHTIEARDSPRHQMTDEIVYCKHEADRDHILELFQAKGVEFVPMTDDRKLLVLGMCHLALGVYDSAGFFGWAEDDPIITFVEAVCSYGAHFNVEPREVRFVMSQPPSALFEGLLRRIQEDEEDDETQVEDDTT
jgi:hypothetical protein